MPIKPKDNHSKIDDTLYFIAQRGWKKSTDDFFVALVTHLAESLNVAYAFVDKFDPLDNNSVQTISLYAQGKITENVTYSLKGTPCENVIGKTLCCYTEQVQKIFPKDELLVTMMAESYVGIPLWDSKGEAIGLIALMDDKPLVETKLAETLLQIVAVRAAAELENQAAENELHASEERFKRTFEHAGVGIAHISLDGNILLVNNRFSSIIGRDKDVLATTPISSITHPSDRDKNKNNLNKLTSNTQEISIEDLRYLCEDGNIVWVTQTTVLNREESAQDYFIAIIEDIGERKINENQLIQAKKAAEEASKAKTSFLQNMSHEIRTPLNAIIGFTEAMSMEILGKEPMLYRDYVQHIHQSGEHLLELINDMLDLSKIDAGLLTLDLSDGDPLNLVNEAVNMMSKIAVLNTVSVVQDINIPEHFLIQLDKHRFRQIVINLLGNAIKFSEGKEVTIQLDHQEKNLILRVIDQGIGMASEDIPIALTPFAQIERDHMSKRYEGSGLGLPITKQLVELHGGKMSIESELGKGTTVTAIF
ncbi:ATP-binding protein [Kiloniella antarctica]|uniref:histidine kinase n=1 Tax=Kiloniella antarctica TaxID=1550907 RepID=A0ABW5BLZ8_9PROT